MAIPIIALAAIATVVAGNAAYDYLFPDNDPPVVNNTTALSALPPYVPPFLGGQCSALYTVTVYLTRFYPNGSIYTEGDVVLTGVMGAITGIRIEVYYLFGTKGHTVFITRAGGETLVNNFRDNNVATVTATIKSIVKESGVDNCGNLPNPNSDVPPPIPSGGVPQNNTNPITGGDQLVEGGLPVVFVPSALSALAGLAAQLGAAIANAQAAADTLAAIKATADAVDKLAKMLDAHKETLDKLRKYLNKKEKEDDANKRYLIRQYGTILRDGYLDLTPRPAPEGFKPLMLDFLCANVPNGLGRFFGINSYNWFRYQELGSICFLSPTSGVLSVHKIEHVRTSIAIPELAIGFTYNMGLNGIIRARVSMLYTQEKT